MEDCKGGFPHSEITGSKGASASPVLIAACHVLHRLSTPRHPSEALQRLIVSQQNSCLVYSARLERCRGTKPDFLSDNVFFSNKTSKLRGAGHVLPLRYQCTPTRRPTANLNAITRSWWSQTESNRRHPACKAGALPTELWPHSIRNGAKPRRAVIRYCPRLKSSRAGRPGQTRTADLTLIRRTL